MSFLNPWFFAGALSVSVPIFLHLIKRERSRRIEFPSLMYLRRVSKKVIRFQKIRHLLLLLLRIAAFLLLALAFTRPFRNLPQLAAATGRAATTAHVILLDNSMSMAYGDRWDRARKAALDIAARAQTGDRVALVEFSDRVTALTQAGDAAAVRAQLAGSMEISDRPTRYGQALKAAERMALEATVDRRVIHLISDFQRSGSGADEANFRLAGSIALEPVSVASPSYSNLTFGDVTVRDSDDAAAGGALKIKASVVNFGTEDRRSVGVHLRLDGRGVQDRTVDVPKAGLQAVEFDLPGLTSGPHALVLEVDDANLVRDNRFSMMIESRGKTPVFSVETPVSGRRSESFFLAPALNVSSLSPYRLMEVTPQRLETQGALSTGIVVWSGIPSPAGAVQRVHDYVRSGGGLVAALGGQVRAPDWNRTFGTWLPVQLDESPAAAGRRPAVDYALLTDLRMEHGIFRPFGDPHSGSFSTAKFFNHHRLKFGPGAEILARFDNGDAALVAAQVDRGRVLVWASSADDSWNDLPLKSVFAPFWQQMLRHVDNYKENRRWLEVGETIAPQGLLADAALRQGKGVLDAGQAIVLLDPDKKRIPLQASSAVAAVERAGFYEVRSSGLNTSVAVNPVSRESDLAPGDAAEMVAGWISHEAQAAAAAGIGDRPPAEDQERREGFWRFLLLAVLVFLLSEAVLANRLVVKPE